MQFFRKNNPVAFTILVGLLSVVIGFQAGQLNWSLSWQNYRPVVRAVNNQPPPNLSTIDFALFWKVWEEVANKYVDKKAIDPDKMYYGAIQGMVAAVGDPYTIFLPPSAQEATKEDLGGSFEGVGIELGYNKDKNLVVIAPLQGSPAEKAGIQAGDVIVKINGKDSTGITLPDAVNLIRGPKGSQVSLQIYREGADKPQDFSITRDTIVVKSVQFSLKQSPAGRKIAYIRLSRFGDRTAQEWDEAVGSTLASGAEGVILDVRNNPGGYLAGARYIGSEFLDEGRNVVLQQDARGGQIPYPVNRRGRLLKLPLVVLINRGSASASEIVSGAIQDYKRGTLVGGQSFGKGTIQDTEDLPGGTGLHITTAKWLTPTGRWIHGTGLTPDIKVDAGTDQSKDLQFDKALAVFDAGNQ